MNGRSDTDPPPAEPPKSLADVSIGDRWAPLVRDPQRREPQPSKPGQRVIASALSLIVLALLLWALT